MKKLISLHLLILSIQIPYKKQISEKYVLRILIII